MSTIAGHTLGSGGPPALLAHTFCAIVITSEQTTSANRTGSGGSAGSSAIFCTAAPLTSGFRSPAYWAARYRADSRLCDWYLSYEGQFRDVLREVRGSRAFSFVRASSEAEVRVP